jgi:hypothetical protein
MHRTFSRENQAAFARLSGDHNPIHADPLAARRLLFGDVIAYGFDALLWSIDQLLSNPGPAGTPWLKERGPFRLSAVSAEFRHPIYLDTPVDLQIEPAGAPQRFLLSISHAEILLARFTVALSEEEEGHQEFREAFPPVDRPRDLGPDQMSGEAGELPLQLERAAARRLYPALERRFSLNQLAALLACSRLVGMVMPGLCSLDLSCSFAVPGSGDPGFLRYRADSYDERFALLHLGVACAGFAGTILAGVRPRPAAQRSVTEIGALVGPGEFSGIRGLVIGGSRGLGEVLVKALSAGGGEVRFSYRQGASDAARIAAEITATGRPAAYFPFEACQDGPRLAERLGGWKPNVLCFMATPPMHSRYPGFFSIEQYHSLTRVYLDGFLETFHAVRAASEDLRHVVAPSSQAVEAAPANLAEHAAAKASAEILGRALARCFPELQFHLPRLRGQCTDQRPGLVPPAAEDAAPVAIGLLRKLRCAKAGTRR